jgi:hypothetical protein
MLPGCVAASVARVREADRQGDERRNGQHDGQHERIRTNEREEFPPGHGDRVSPRISTNLSDRSAAAATRAFRSV